jgi:hypothetical protein
MNRQAALVELNDKIIIEGLGWQKGSDGRNLTSHSTGAQISLFFIRQLEGLVRFFRARSTPAFGGALNC